MYQREERIHDESREGCHERWAACETTLSNSLEHQIYDTFSDFYTIRPTVSFTCFFLQLLINMFTAENFVNVKVYLSLE